MEQEPTPITELLKLIIFLGSIVFISGAIYQIYVLGRIKKSWRSILVIVALTRVLTISLSLIILHAWNFPFDVMYSFVFLPAILPELILSPLMLKIFGHEEKSHCTTVHNNNV